MRLTLARFGVALAVLVPFAAECLAERKKSVAAPMEIAVAEGAFSDEPEGSPRRNLAFDRAKELGATHIRGFLPWEKTPNGVYDDCYKYFGRWDSTVNEAIRRGFEVQLSLMGFASKVYGGPDRTGVDPDPREYAKFVAACARHFKGRVHRYSIWNEPNLPVFLMPAPATGPGGSFVDAVDRATGKKLSPTENYRKNILPKNAKRYRELYNVGYKAIKAVDPSAQVWIGELSSSHDPIAFLEAMAPPGERLIADGFAHHPYQFAVAPDAPPNPNGTGCGISKTNVLQARLAKLAKERRLTTPGGGKLPLYLTEFGYQKLEGRTFQSPGTQIPEATRALWLPKAFAVAKAAGAKQMLYFMLLPTPPDYAWDTSLVDRSGAPLSSFLELKKWIAGGGQATATPDDGLALPHPKGKKKPR